MSTRPRFVVVTPLRDELERLPGLVQSLLAQTLRPDLWVLANDGSTDGSGDWIDTFAASHPDWVKAVHCVDRGYRAGGGGVHAFWEGQQAAADVKWDFLVNLDADLTLPPDYFERCLGEFARDPELGIGGGIILNRIGGRLVPERLAPYHVRGATKIYRRACWEAIGGVHRRNGWDTIDEVKAQHLGFGTRTFEHIRLVQERFTGNGLGQWSNWAKNGRACFALGYHPLFFIARCVRKLATWPPGLASLGLARGYVGAAFTGTERIPEPEAIRFMRREQLRSLMGQPSKWR